MTDQHDFHKQIAMACFNQAWGLIETPNRTPTQDREMCRLAEVSFWHWLQHPDCTDKNRSISLWQLARVYTLVGLLETASAYAQDCVEISSQLENEPFFLGYAYEAVARIAQAKGDEAGMAAAMTQAQEMLAQVTDEESAEILRSDLESLG